MNFFSEWLIVVTLMVVCAMAPGPDFVMSIRNSLIYSRKTGVLTAAGFALGVAIHSAYCILGIAAVISKSIMLFNIIKYIGAAYLIYMGIKALRSKGFGRPEGLAGGHRKDIHWSKALGMGFMTNILNPKATMFFFALYTQVIDPHTPIGVLMIFAATCIAITFAWFCIVAFVLTDNRVRNKFLGFSQWIDRVCGGAMIALGLRLALSKATAHTS